jgi:hypothetical protein
MGNSAMNNYEIEVCQEITQGLLDNGWKLRMLEKKGRGWVFFIEPVIMDEDEGNPDLKDYLNA